MTLWTRVPLGVHLRCGGCGEAIPAGAPVARLTLSGVRRPLARCAACAGPAPPDLPAVPVAAPPPDPRPPVRLAAVMAGPTWSTGTPIARIAGFDWRARAAGREPGEDA